MCANQCSPLLPLRGQYAVPEMPRLSLPSSKAIGRVVNLALSLCPSLVVPGGSIPLENGRCDNTEMGVNKRAKYVQEATSTGRGQTNEAMNYKINHHLLCSRSAAPTASTFVWKAETTRYLYLFNS